MSLKRRSSSKPRLLSETNTCSYNSYSTSSTAKIERFDDEEKIDSESEDYKLNPIAEELSGSVVNENSSKKTSISSEASSQNGIARKYPEHQISIERHISSPHADMDRIIAYNTPYQERHKSAIIDDSTTIYQDYFSPGTKSSNRSSISVVLGSILSNSDSKSHIDELTSSDYLRWRIHSDNTYNSRDDLAPKKTSKFRKNKRSSKRSSSCSRADFAKIKDLDSLNKLYYCDYKLTMDSKDLEEAFYQNIVSNNTQSCLDTNDSFHLRRVYHLEEAKAYTIVVNNFNKAKHDYIVDRNKKQEKTSDEPFVIYKKGPRMIGNSNFTNIQAICFQKLLDEVMSRHLDDNAFEDRRIKSIRVFLAAHDLVCSSEELLDQVINRFFVPIPACMSQQEAQRFQVFVKEPLQLKILEFLMKWMDLREADFLENLSLRRMLYAFLNFGICVSSAYITKVLQSIKRSLLSTLNKQRSGPDPQSYVINLHILNITSCYEVKGDWFYNDKSIFDIDHATSLLFKYSSEEFSQQMTLIDSALHKEIRQQHLPSNKKNKARVDPIHLISDQNSGPKCINFYQKMIEQTNFRTFLFVFLIIAQTSAEKRREVVARLFDIAEKSLNFKNYHGFSCVLGAVTNMSVVLQNTDWNPLSIITKQRKAEFENLYKKNDKLRKRIKDSPLPLVPCLMSIVEDVERLMAVQSALIELEDHTLVNFKLMEELYTTTTKFFSAQKSNYRFKPIPEVINFLQVDSLRLMGLLNKNYSISDIQARLMAMAKIH